MKKKLTQDEVNALIRKLQMKYKAEYEDINIAIQRDIDLYGHVTLETLAAKDKLSEKMMKEKESYASLES